MTSSYSKTWLLGLLLLAISIFLITPAHASASGLYVIQYSGPVQDNWVKDLHRTSGVRVISFQSDHSYLVSATEPGLDRLRGKSEGSGAPTLRKYTGEDKVEGGMTPRLPIGLSLKSEVDIVIVDSLDYPGTIATIESIAGDVIEGTMARDGLRFARVSLTTTSISEIADLENVVSIERHREPVKLDERQSLVLAGRFNIGGFGPSSESYLDWLSSKGFSSDPSKYPIVEVADDGFDNGLAASPAHPDFYINGEATPDGSRVAYAVDDWTADSNAQGGGGHGTINLSIVGGYNSITMDSSGFAYGLGISPFTRLGSSKVFADNGDWGYTHFFFEPLVMSAHNRGARIISNSWGEPGSFGVYDFQAEEYDLLVRDADSGAPGLQSTTVLFAAGNEGLQGSTTINTPGTAKNVITVGAAENFRQDVTIDGCGIGNLYANDVRDIAPFSSRGPTDDGRIKPDIVAPGTHIQGAASQIPGFSGNGVCGSSSNNRVVPGDDAMFPLGQSLYTWSSGTSHATPAVAGAASLVHEYYDRTQGVSPSPAMTKAILINGARYLTGNGANDTLPSPNQGFGMVDIGRLVDPIPKYFDDQTTTFDATSEQKGLLGVVSNPSEEVRVTLVWTDAPGSPSAPKALVNDLDLQVTAGGDVYKGNRFSGQYSTANSGQYDRLNNVEGVVLPVGTTGRIDVTIEANEIAGDGIPGSGDITDQDFAVVLYNLGSVSEYDPSAIIGSVVVSGDAKTVASRSVSLALEASGRPFIPVTEFRVSNDGIFDAGGPGDNERWRPLSGPGPGVLSYSESSLEWMLPPGEGRKTVFAQFRDQSSDVSGVVSDEVYIDRRVVTFYASTPTVAYGSQGKVAGTVRNRFGNPVVGQKVYIQRLNQAGDPVWIANVFTNSRGYFQKWFFPVGKRDYRASVAGSATYPERPSGTSAISVTPGLVAWNPYATRTYGQWTRVHGLLRNGNGAGMAGVRVFLQAWDYATRTWVWKATGTTTGSGYYDYWFKPYGTSRYRVATTGSQYRSNEVTKTVRHKPTLSLSRFSTTLGRFVRISGEVQPRHPGQVAYIQWWNGTSWAYLATVHMDSSSRYAKWWRAPWRGTWPIRLHVPAHWDHVENWSPVRSLSVR